MKLMLRNRATPASATGAHAIGTTALGTAAIGAVAVGALALGALSIGRLFIGRARIRHRVIDELGVRRIRIVEEPDSPMAPEPGSVGNESGSGPTATQVNVQ